MVQVDISVPVALAGVGLIVTIIFATWRISSVISRFEHKLESMEAGVKTVSEKTDKLPETIWGKFIEYYHLLEGREGKK